MHCNKYYVAMQILCKGGDVVNRFIEYIEETLHISVDVSVCPQRDSLPLYLRNGIDLYTLTIQSVQCLLARPKETANLSALRKRCVQLKKLTGLDCVLCLDRARIYTKGKMLSEGIPFIIVGQQVYMPFLGIALAQNAIRDIPYKYKISFSTQKMLLTAVYQGWEVLNRLMLTPAVLLFEEPEFLLRREVEEIGSYFSIIKRDGTLEERNASGNVCAVFHQWIY